MKKSIVTLVLFLFTLFAGVLFVDNSAMAAPRLSSKHVKIKRIDDTAKLKIKGVKSKNVKSLTVVPSNKDHLEIFIKNKTEFSLRAKANTNAYAKVTLKLKKKIDGKKTYKFKVTSEVEVKPGDYKSYPILQGKVEDKYKLVYLDESDPRWKQIAEDTEYSLNCEWNDINVENPFGTIAYHEGYDIFKDYDFIRYWGKITATDYLGNDKTDHMTIYVTDYQSHLKNHSRARALIYLDDEFACSFPLDVSVIEYEYEPENFFCIDKEKKIYAKIAKTLLDK